MTAAGMHLLNVQTVQPFMRRKATTLVPPGFATIRMAVMKLHQTDEYLLPNGVLCRCSARIQLREGPTSRLRKTLRETEEDFTSVSEVVRCVTFRGCLETVVRLGM